MLLRSPRLFRFLRRCRRLGRRPVGRSAGGWARRRRWLVLAALGWGLGLILAALTAPAIAQTPSPTGAPATPAAAPAPTPDPVATVVLPKSLQPAPVIAAADPGQYVLEFNRSPVVGNRLRFSGIYDERRLRFTRPRNWQTQTVQLVLRYRHSAALYATRSNLTAIINGTSVGSVPLNQPQGEIGTATFEVPLHLLQDYNELVIAALQNNSPTCTQDPYDPSLWTEVMPDSKLVFDFVPQAVTPDFSQFPYPLFDALSLQTNRVSFLQPATTDAAELTSLARFQAALGRIADYRPLDTRLVSSWDDLLPQERLVIIGTPKSQPDLAALDLPLSFQDGQFLDGDGRAIAPDVGILIWTTRQQGQVPVLVATGNGAAGVAKGVQFLVQGGDRSIGAGHVLLVNQVVTPPAPGPRDWPGYLPPTPDFQMADLRTDAQQPLEDVTVRGSHSPAVELDFKALPDDRIQPGAEMVLRYSYGPQVNPLTSMVEVELDGVAIEGRRLTALEGARGDTLKVALPVQHITPTSRLQINFRLDPRERRSCSRVTDQQLWGTVHSDSSFHIPRESLAQLPDLKLLRTGFPFTAPQDLSSLAVVLPDQPTPAELSLLRSLLERLGRLSQADSVQLQVYPVGELPEAVRSDRHLIAIGTQDRFPLPELLETGSFTLGERLTRQWNGSQVQALPDAEGLVKATLSPWNSSRVALALAAQAPAGLGRLAELFRYDPLFYQLEGDTALISAAVADPDPDAAQDYRLEFLRQSARVTVATAPASRRFWRLLRSHWLFVVPTMVGLSLLLYGVAQTYLRRVTEQDG